MHYSHIPVLLKEVIEFLAPKPGQVFVDATLGGGGYTQTLAEMVGEKGKVLAIDADSEAIANCRSKLDDFKFKDNIRLIHGNFRDLTNIVTENGIDHVDGIVADLGLSSFELDAAGRGMSFQKDEFLDMRFDTSSGKTAADILIKSSQQDLVKLFSNFGEEKYSKRIARGIIHQRQKGEIETSGKLLSLIRQALPAPVKHRAADSARRIFQALRIEVNAELEALNAFLPQAFRVLGSGGRLAVVSFHSLEDRIVKNFFSQIAKSCVCPPEFPQCICDKKTQGKILTKKPVKAAADEANLNPRSKSAKLRVIEKN